MSEDKKTAPKAKPAPKPEPVAEKPKVEEAAVRNLTRERIAAKAGEKRASEMVG